MKQFYRLIFTLLLTILAGGFSIFAQTGFYDGVFILNEGSAGTPTASVSFISNEGILQNNIYGTVNPGQANLGDVAQHIGFHGDYAYIVLNMSNTIKVVNRNTFAYVATISTGLVNPRYIAFANGKGYVTNWGNGGVNDSYVAVVNLETNTVESSIALAEGVERILEINGKLYVAHQGGYGYGNTISVINPVTTAIEQVITVGDVPNSIIEKEGSLYVLCGGKPSWAGTQTYGKLVQINLADNTVISETDFPNQHPSNLKIEGNALLYTQDAAVYKTTVTPFSVPTTPLFSLGAQGVYGIYGMEVIDGKIFLGDAGNYVSNGTVYVYTMEGTQSSSHVVGKLPNGFYKATESNLGVTNPEAALAVTVYPNPASGVFYIRTAKTGDAMIKVYDLTGRLVKDQKYTLSGINVSDLTAGIYSVEVTIENAKYNQRIIVK